MVFGYRKTTQIIPGIKAWSAAYLRTRECARVCAREVAASKRLHAISCHHQIGVTVSIPVGSMNSKSVDNYFIDAVVV